MLARFRQLLKSLQEEAHIFGHFRSLFMELVTADGTWEHYEGLLRFVDSGGNIIADRLGPADYADLIDERAQPDSYLNSPYYKPLGYPERDNLCRLESGLYRLGTLARLNICDRIGTPLAEQALQHFRQHGKSANGIVNSSFYHYARLIEILTCLERIEIGLADVDLQSERLRSRADVNRLEAVGVGEAPRGTLFHHYKIDETGLLTQVNLIIATGQNNLAMNRTVAQIARHYIHGDTIPEPMLNRVEAGIRAFDPCLSCSTHAARQMALQIELVDAKGQQLDQLCR